jgi:hypothetical protein
MLMTWPALRALKSVVISAVCAFLGGEDTVNVKRQTFHEELGDGNETKDVRCEHSVDVALLYISNAVGAVRAASVVDCRDEIRKTQVEKGVASHPDK